ncbi:MAG: hypothetical protein U0441_06775 [Polyangiaceae bacterium]
MRKLSRASSNGPFYGKAFVAALALAIASLTACQAPQPTGKYKGPSTAAVTAEEGGGGPGDTSSGGTDDSDAPCEDGAVKECQVVLGEHEGVVTCFEGEQKCTDGKWGDCDEPEDDDDS